MVQFEWYLDDIRITGQNQSQVQLTAPATQSQAVLKCRISLNGKSAEDTLHIQVVAHIPTPPVVTGIQSASKYTVISGTNTFTAQVTPTAGEVLTYEWSASAGVLSQATGNPVSWQAPATAGVSTITLKVTNQDVLSTTVTSDALAKDTSLAIQTPLIYYPFDWDTKNAVADRFHATVSGASKTEDSRGLASLAYRFTSGSNIISTENNADLNFGNAISLSCWVKCEQLGSERFIISHGSYQQRYKLSITPEGKLRWTIKTSMGIADLDGSAPIALNQYYHVTVLYTGYSMELYVDGVLDSFKAFSGVLQPSTKPITIGRMDNVETLYALLGSIDEVKLWDKEIPVKQIGMLKNQWNTSQGIAEDNLVTGIYPNPATDLIYVGLAKSFNVSHISLIAMDGREVKDLKQNIQGSVIAIEIPEVARGFYLIRIILKDGSIVNRKIVIR